MKKLHNCMIYIKRVTNKFLRITPEPQSRTALYILYNVLLIGKIK